MQQQKTATADVASAALQPHLKEERQDHHQQQQCHYGEVAGDEGVEDAVV